MNETQSILFEIIYKIASIPNISKHKSTVLYGLANYVARYSLMNDHYYISEKAKAHIIKNKWSLNPLSRSKKSIKNGFTYEHPIPSNYITKEILKNPTKEKIKKILTKTDHIAIITQDENKQIKSRSKMPDKWKIGDNIWARYKNTKIKILKAKIKMEGVAHR